jgi:hypothetical protein
MNAIPAHNDRYGRLTVLRVEKSEKHGTRYICGCACGSKRNIFRAAALNSGRVTKCNRCYATGERG